MDFPIHRFSEEDFERSNASFRRSVAQGHLADDHPATQNGLNDTFSAAGGQIRYGRGEAYPSTVTNPSAADDTNWAYGTHSSYGRVGELLGDNNFCNEPHTVQSQICPEILDWPVENQYLNNTSAAVTLRTQPQYESHANIEHTNTAPDARNEKHQFFCEHPGCGKSFTKQGDLKRHVTSLHDPNSKVFVCGCCDETVPPHNWKRLDKLRDHKSNCHGLTRGSGIKRCPECHGHDGREEVYFCNNDALERHKELVHRNKSVDVSPEPSSNVLKRGHEGHRTSADKRMQIQIPCGRVSEESSKSPYFERLSIYEHLFKLGYKIGPVASGIEIFNVRVSDIIRLMRLEGGRGEEGHAHGTKSRISCNIFNASIRIRGSDDLTSKLKEFYELCTAGPSLKNSFPLNLVCFDSRFPETSSGTVVAQKIYVMRKVEDEKVLAIWHRRVIPGLPEILRNYVGDTYSASLVRRGTSELSSVAEIRIQTYTVPARNVREHIREQVQKLVGPNSDIRCPQIEFSKGHLTKLASSVAGDGDSNDMSEQDDADTNEDSIYPWNQLYWPNPGPGASIGLQCTRAVAATAGCLVNIGMFEGQQFILTVKHLITDSCQHSHGYLGDPATILSPALLHVDDLKSKLTQFISNFKLDLRRAWSHHRISCPSDYFSPEEFRGFPQDIVELVEAIAKIQEDLTRLQNNDALELGSLMFTNKNADDFDHHQPHLDWALVRVNRERTGNNRHRYPFDSDNSKVNYYADEMASLDARPQFWQTGVVEPNIKVHFVGQGTGRQSGEINAAQTLVSIEGRSSTEWGIILDPDRQRDSNSHQGDSGATIIGDHSNKLLGLLWAWASGQLLFTDINAVFADIERTVGSPVSLPSADTMPPPSATPIPAQTISVIEPKEKVVSPQPQRKITPRDVLGPPKPVTTVMENPLSPAARLRRLSQAKEVAAQLDNLVSSSLVSTPTSAPSQTTTTSESFGPSQDIENKFDLQYIVNNFHKNKTWPMLQQTQEKRPRRGPSKRAKTIPFLKGCNPRAILGAIDVN